MYNKKMSMIKEKIQKSVFKYGNFIYFHNKLQPFRKKRSL